MSLSHFLQRSTVAAALWPALVLQGQDLLESCSLSLSYCDKYTASWGGRAQRLCEQSWGWGCLTLAMSKTATSWKQAQQLGSESQQQTAGKGSLECLELRLSPRTASFSPWRLLGGYRGGSLTSRPLESRTPSCHHALSP